MKTPTWDSPEETVEGSVKAQQLILSGYRGSSNTNKKKHVEASMPRHVAINLTGGPTFCTPLGELMHAFHRRDSLLS